ncbi:uncharacterized protein LOC144120388 [Amblyomma americanum]
MSKRIRLFSQFLGKWWFVRVTADVFHQGEECAHFVVSRKAERLFNITAEFHMPGGRRRLLSLDFLDEVKHPAQYTAFLNEKPVIWATILGTDYGHWAVMHIREGSYESFAVASREPSLTGDFEDAIQLMLVKNNITKEFQSVPTKNCSDGI